MKFVYSLILISSFLDANDMRALIFNGNCTTCHFINETKSAPSIVDVKKHYLNAFPTRDDFINYMSEFVKKPSLDKSIMLDAIRKHQLMPHIAFDDETIVDITSYIYDNDFNQSK